MIRAAGNKPLIERALLHAEDAATQAPEAYFRNSEVDRRDIIREAFRVRLYPNTNLHPKQLAHAIGMTDRALRMLLAGDINPSAGTLGEACRFFWSRGDRAFSAIVLGLPGIDGPTLFDVQRPLAEAHALLGAILQREVA